MDPSNSQRLLAGTDRVYETLNARTGINPPLSGAFFLGTTPLKWNSISDRLTADSFGYLTSIAVAGATIYTASDDGRVFRTTNGGTSWTNITGDLPQPKATPFPSNEPFFTQVALNRDDPSQAWVTIGQLGAGQLFYTNNAGAATGTKWVNLSGTGDTALPDAPAQSVVELPGTSNVYVGTYYGVWQCNTCGGQSPSASWQRLGGTDLDTGALPKVMVDALSLTKDDKTLMAWTHGRGVWKISVP
jgi:hypothetical protein